MPPEPWLRGPIAGLDPLVAPALYAFQQAREDLARYAAPLTREQLWSTPHGFGSVGFHIRHIAGSTLRLLAYLENRELTEAQFDELRSEESPLDLDAPDLLARLEDAFREAETLIRAFDPAMLREPRYVGRKRLPTTAIGLLTHIAEHVQRHVGQAITAARWVATLR